MTGYLNPQAARRVFWTLTATRWLPTGLVVGILILVALDRGLTVAQATTAMAVAGFVVFALELPTSSFADVFGRRPVYLAAAVVNVLAAVLYAVADSVWTFALAGVFTGIFRALDSGPLEAWFVDTVHATDPEAEVDGALATSGTVVGVTMASGSLAAAALIWWHPIADHSAFFLPLVLFVLLNVAHLVAVFALLKEPRPDTGSTWHRALESAKAAPAVVRDGVRLLRDNRVLRGVVCVELFWSIGMIVFETFQPIRLAELLGSEQQAGAWMGVVAAGAWGVFGMGSAMAGLASKRYGVARTAIAVRILNGLGAVVMGLMLGPVALIAAYLVTYLLHGAGGPVHSTLLHREASAGNRATVLSMSSMMMFISFSASMPVLGAVATTTSTPIAMVIAGGVSVLGAACYLPALRRERELEAATPEPVVRSST